MGKYIYGNQLNNHGKNNGNKYIFKVNVNIHGSRHSEFYSINIKELSMAINYGFFREENGYIKYLDWKPIAGSIPEGGVKDVIKYDRDDKYLYAITKDNIFSLPKYLEKDMIRKDKILFGKREK